MQSGKPAVAFDAVDKRVDGELLVRDTGVFLFESICSVIVVMETGVVLLVNSPVLSKINTQNIVQQNPCITHYVHPVQQYNNDVTGP